MASMNYNKQNPPMGSSNGLKQGRNSVSKTQALVPKKSSGNEAIKVCIRVRPLLPHEVMKEEIVYYPDSSDPNLQAIRIADG